MKIKEKVKSFVEERKVEILVGGCTILIIGATVAYTVYMMNARQRGLEIIEAAQKDVFERLMADNTQVLKLADIPEFINSVPKEQFYGIFKETTDDIVQIVNFN